MNAPQDSYDELHALVGALCDDAIDAEQFAHLQHLLASDLAAQQFYVRYMDLYGALRRLEQKDERKSQSFSFGGVLPSVDRNKDRAACDKGLSIGLPLIVPASSAPVSSFASVAFVSYAIAAMVVGSWLLIASMWILPDRTDVARSLPQPDPRAVSDPTCIARITAMVDCVWEGAGFRVQGSGTVNHKSEIRNQNSAVHLGDRLALKSGLLELTYDTGAKVILQGPVAYQVESPSGGYLSLGKLTAKLEKKSEVRGQGSESANQKSEIIDQKFAVRTPTAVVTDLGTEFGVEVENTGRTTSHVFRGSVQMETVVGEGQRTNSRILYAGQAAQTGKSSDNTLLTLQPVTVDPSTFVRADRIPKRVESPNLKPLRRWQTYRDRLCRDPSLLAYYDFQRNTDSPRVLFNVAANADGSLDGTIQGARWTSGRMPGKQALLFNGSNDCVRINVPQRTENLTLAAWVCFYSEAESLAHSLLMSTDWLKPGQIHWLVAKDGHIGFSSMSATDVCDTPPSIIGDGQLNRWVHLACAYDRAARKDAVLPRRSACRGARISHDRGVPHRPGVDRTVGLCDLPRRGQQPSESARLHGRAAGLRPAARRRRDCGHVRKRKVTNRRKESAASGVNRECVKASRFATVRGVLSRNVAWPGCPSPQRLPNASEREENGRRHAGHLRQRVAGRLHAVIGAGNRLDTPFGFPVVSARSLEEICYETVCIRVGYFGGRRLDRQRRQCPLPSTCRQAPHRSR